MSQQFLIAATNSIHKVKEISAMLPPVFMLQSLKDVGYMTDIIEDGETLEENALIKARTLHQFLDKNVFAEDTGLEVTTLGGAPGVHTARYAGDQRRDEDNIQLLLNNLKGCENRTARFRTIIALIFNDKEYLFEGFVEGEIAQSNRGEGGFGYDPVFIPKGHTQTFAELDETIKNTISHRAVAVGKLVKFLIENE
ncbi:MAG: RdgB/HAM1 family non-canonical purine NTP pyrophosphatase [Saprospiraceae bacterium]|nr:RdgB/HAM1 family non-canonical purine NTP pyrophosphatase [Saprospiraceae bacterium]MBK8632934.1 RdgB/HAM1 family non-canonical purine NTP pyrophosphatase [Saprospiraceae bacterium]MBP7642288.1 RdgB/HAM1 family non-canonical purine NTP pyrophosphatase [Saprospiraceae bacterium]HMS70334.1 RdgB/HAM1 family non-canonical purine NTP pyrophosphatase [Saprospiraceae bacterium]